MFTNRYVSLSDMFFEGGIAGWESILVANLATKKRQTLINGVSACLSAVFDFFLFM